MNEFEFWKEYYKRVLPTVLAQMRMLRGLIIGLLCEYCAYKLLKELFPDCNIKRLRVPASHDLVIICRNVHDKVFVEVKHLELDNPEYWRRHKKRMHIAAAVSALRSGRHYLYLFIDPQSGRYKFRHALYVLRELYRANPDAFYRIAKTRVFHKFVKAFTASRMYLVYKLYRTKRVVASLRRPKSPV